VTVCPADVSSCRRVFYVLIRCFLFFFSSRRRHTRFSRDWSSDVCSSDLRLETTWLPTYEVPATAAQVGDGSDLAGVELSMDALAEAEVDALRAGLAPLADGYRRWLDAQETRIPDLPESLQEAARTAVFRARAIADRIQAGIDLLTDPTQPRHQEALTAFRFANRAMAQQRRHTEIARLRDEQGIGFAAAKAAIDRKKPAEVA